MFETLFTYSRVLRSQREGPLAEERAAYLIVLAAHSVAPATLLKQARCCLRVAVELERWSAVPITVSTLTKWARWPPDTQRSVGPHQAGMPRNIFAPQPPTSCATSAVYGWTGAPFRTHTRPCCASSSPCSTNRAGCPTPPAGRRDGTSRGSSTTSGGGGLVLQTLQSADIDAFYQHMAVRWNRSGTQLRADIRSSAE